MFEPVTTTHFLLRNKTYKDAIPSNTNTAAIAAYFTPAYKIPQANANNLNTITNDHTANPSTNAPAAAPSGVILSSDIPGKFVVRRRNTLSFPSSVNRFIAFSSINHHGESSSSFFFFLQNRHPRAYTDTSLETLFCVAVWTRKRFDDVDACALNDTRSSFREENPFCGRIVLNIPHLFDDEDEDEARTPEAIRNDPSPLRWCCTRKKGDDGASAEDIFIIE